MTTEPMQCGFVALVGAPNAGKSTLLNQLIGGKVSIVSPKSQTTRMRITGVCMQGRAQLVFVDTPGMFAAEEKFDRAMVRVATNSLNETDAALFVVDAGHARGPAFAHALKMVQQSRTPVALVLNKVDAVAKHTLLELAARLNAEHNFADTFMISALKGDGVADIRTYLAGRMPEGVWMYPEDQLTDISERLLAAEITREALLLQLHEEIPHQLWVETEKFVEAEDGVLELHQAVIVAREGHKKIVLGHQGSRIKSVGMAARREMRHVLGRPVRLNLFVKVDPKWRDRSDAYRAMGLEF